MTETWAQRWKRVAKQERDRRIAAQQVADLSVYTVTTLQSEIDYWRWYHTQRREPTDGTEH